MQQQDSIEGQSAVQKLPQRVEGAKWRDGAVELAGVRHVFPSRARGRSRLFFLCFSLTLALSLP